MKYYLKKLTANELGYRKGVAPSSLYAFFISSKAAEFFPKLSHEILNDYTYINVFIEHLSANTKLKLVYHNLGYHSVKSNKSEYHLYLNKEAAPSIDAYLPNDIVIFKKLSSNNYSIKLIRNHYEKKIYSFLNEIIDNSSIRGKHALVVI